MPRWAVRTLFLAAVVALPLQLAVREVAAEPYPGLYQPSFGGEVASGEGYRTLEPRLTVEEADGSTVAVSYLDILPRTDVLPSTVFRHAFRSSASQRPETRAWLRDRLLATGAASDPRSLTVEWVEVERRLDSGRTEDAGVVDRERIDVGEGS